MCCSLEQERRGELRDHAGFCRQDEKEQKLRCGEEAGSFREEKELEPVGRKSHQGQRLAPGPPRPMAEVVFLQNK